MEPDTHQQDDVETVVSPKRSIFGWSISLTLIGTYCGGYLGGFLGAILVGGLLLFLSRWRKVHVTTVLILSPLLFVTGSVLRTEQISQRARVYRAAQTKQESIAQRSQIGSMVAERTAPASDDWDVVASTFQQTHPDLKLGNNLAMMQDAVNRLAQPDMSALSLLQKGYVAASLTVGWTHPQASPTQPTINPNIAWDSADGTVVSSTTGPAHLPRSGIYKCSVSDGAVEYRNSPCDAAQTDLASISSDPATGKSYSGQHVTVNFATAKVGAVMHMLADVSRYDLYIDDSRDIVGTFRYVNEPSDQVAAEIADKYGLSIEYQGKKMIVSKR